MNERIALGYKLGKKHNVHTTAELLQIRDDLEQQLQAVLNIDDAIIGKEKEAMELKQRVIKKPMIFLL